MTLQQVRAFVQWTADGMVVGLLSGGASAVFLALLDLVTAWRTTHPGVVYTLPLAGIILGLVYTKWGMSILGGNNLVLNTVHEAGSALPIRMAPMVLLGTVLTHLFGGSAGREGTAVQMGASLADAVAYRWHVTPERRRGLLVAGIAGGFGSVFGTPIAGTLFALEAVVVGRLHYDALVPALVAALLGDLVTRSLGIVHTAYPIPAVLPLTPLLLGTWIGFGLAVALVSRSFILLTDLLKTWLQRWVPSLPLRMALGGSLVVCLWQGLGTDAYLGLGLPTILRAFTDPHLPLMTFLYKLVFTAVTLSAGFMGGEVTPLFFVGATLGNGLGRLCGLPLDLAAGVGLAATFAAAANTPLALSVMAVELMGAAVLPHVVIVAVVAYLFTGHRSIYPAQRIARLKHGGAPLPQLVPLREASAISRNTTRHDA